MHVCARAYVCLHVCALPRGYLPWSNYRMRKPTPSTSEQTGCNTIRIPQLLPPETPTKNTKNNILSCTTNDSGGDIIMDFVQLSLCSVVRNESD